MNCAVSGGDAMTDALLLIIVLGTSGLTVTVVVAAAFGWLRRRGDG